MNNPKNQSRWSASFDVVDGSVARVVYVSVMSAFITFFAAKVHSILLIILFFQQETT